MEDDIQDFARAELDFKCEDTIRKIIDYARFVDKENEKADLLTPTVSGSDFIMELVRKNNLPLRTAIAMIYAVENPDTEYTITITK